MVYNVFDDGRLIGQVKANSLREALAEAQRLFPLSVSRLSVKLVG